MASQIMFFEKNKIDLENQDTVITITDTVAANNGQEFVDFMRNRNNFSAWLTTDSTDAANTQLDIAVGDGKNLTEILIIGHNLKAYTIQWKSGLGSYQDFNPAINVTNDTQSSTLHTFSTANATDIRIIITGTQVVDADKIIKQLIITDRIGQFEGWPTIRKPTVSLNKRNTKMLSGKRRIVRSLESFSCTLDVRHWRNQADIDLLETIYFKREGVLMYLSGNDVSQFFLDLKGYRREDIFLVSPIDDWKPELITGLYQAGIKVGMKLVEVIT